MIGTPLAFQATCVSTVVAAHWMAPEASARWRSFCGIILSSTSSPFFLKMPALSASVSGAKPVQPDMPSAILVLLRVGRAGGAEAGGNEGGNLKRTVSIMETPEGYWTEGERIVFRSIQSCLYRVNPESPNFGASH